MELELLQWYLIKSRYIKSKTGQEIVAAKYLGGKWDYSWELSIPIKHPSKHCGELYGGIKGRYGYCVYTLPEKIIKKLKEEEIFLEIL
jgi:hypothetical protein